MIIMACLPLCAFSIETSRGTKNLEVPEGFTLEEAYCEMAKMYLEERWEHEELIEKANALVESVEKYEKELDILSKKNSALDERYSSLNERYSNLMKLYEEETKIPFMRALVTTGMNFYYTESVPVDITIGIGTVIKDKYILGTEFTMRTFQLRLGFVY